MKQHLQKSERVKAGGVYTTKRPKQISDEKKKRKGTWKRVGRWNRMIYPNGVMKVRKQFGESLCDWLRNHYLVKTGDHYRITKEEMALISQGKIPGETLSESIAKATE
ncbi:MAG: hypothetical protein KKD44_28535 [Proteobacteria bacterium]|nr:hypothetical protein [Pseudomonadota bacterium]